MRAELDKNIVLQAAIQKLAAGHRMTEIRLRRLLGEEGYHNYQAEWAEQVQLREELKNPPRAIVEYQERLREATFSYSKAEFASARGQRTTSRRLYALAETQFERTVEYLDAVVAGNDYLEIWLDRPVHFDFGNMPIASCEEFPCVVTSKSLRNLGGGLLALKRSKRQVRIDALQSAFIEAERKECGDAEVEDRLAAAARLRNLANC